MMKKKLTLLFFTRVVIVGFRALKIGVSNRMRPARVPRDFEKIARRFL
jgi:hypothetical protein